MTKTRGAVARYEWRDTQLDNDVNKPQHRGVECSPRVAMPFQTLLQWLYFRGVETASRKFGPDRSVSRGIPELAQASGSAASCVHTGILIADHARHGTLDPTVCSDLVLYHFSTSSPKPYIPHISSPPSHVLTSCRYSRIHPIPIHNELPIQKR